MTTREIKHEETCEYEFNGEYSRGCVACLHQLVKDSIKALSVEIGDFVKPVEHYEKQKMIDRLTFFMQLEKNIS